MYHQSSPQECLVSKPKTSRTVSLRLWERCLSPRLTHSVDNSQPTFLRRLRGELTGDNSDRHERPIPRNKRLNKDDEDDAPTYVLEDTNQSLTKAEYEELVARKDAPRDDEQISPGADKPNSNAPQSTKQTKDNIVELGAATKKRKAARIIGDESEVKDSTGIDTKAKKKAKKKGKPIKLSFRDEEE